MLHSKYNSIHKDANKSRDYFNSYTLALVDFVVLMFSICICRGMQPFLLRYTFLENIM